MSFVRNHPLKENIVFPVLVPNLRGLEAAIESGATEVAVFASASEGFSQKNINCSIAESLIRFEEVCRTALPKGIRVRGYFPVETRLIELHFLYHRLSLRRTYTS